MGEGAAEKIAEEQQNPKRDLLPRGMHRGFKVVILKGSLEVFSMLGDVPVGCSTHRDVHPLAL